MVVNGFESISKSKERRARRRFITDQELRYKVLPGIYSQRIAETGVGRALNISSSGLWFTAENATLKPGTCVEISMNWPILLNLDCPLKIVICGRIVRANETGAAMAIKSYEFRTRGGGRIDHKRPELLAV
jgi:hypothetical protein